MMFFYITDNPDWGDRRYPQGNRRWVIGTNFRGCNGSASRRCSHTECTTAGAAVPWKTTTASSTESSGAFTPVLPGGTSQNATAPGRPFTGASDVGGAMAHLPIFSPTCCWI